MTSNEWSRSLKILGVDECAGFDEIQSVYRRLVLKYHPDVNCSKNASRRFREIVEAYGIVVEATRTREAVAGQRLYESVKKDRFVRKMEYEELRNRFRYSSSPHVRASAVIALVLQEGEESKEILFEALRDSDESVRFAALQVAGTICGLKDIPKILFPVLFRKNPDMRKRGLEEIVHIIQRSFKEYNQEHPPLGEING